MKGRLCAANRDDNDGNKLSWVRAEFDAWDSMGVTGLEKSLVN